MELQDFDTGLRFEIAGGRFTIGSGSGTHLAYLPEEGALSLDAKNRFVLQAE
jgi:hypothetical protein